MTEPDEIAASSMELLHAWGGYSSMAEVMARFVGLELYLAGGVIRDRVLQREQPPRDFDIFLSGPAVDQAIASLSHSGQLRKTPFGSPRWFPSEAPKQYCDLIPISRFSNGLWECGNIDDALRQFDFTGNAMAIDLRTCKFFDPVNGMRDMHRRLMKMVVEYPNEPIAPTIPLSRVTVLWFRILHYAATLNLEIEPNRKSG